MNQTNIDDLAKATAIAQRDRRFADSGNLQTELDRQQITVLSNVDGWVGWHRIGDDCIHYLRYADSRYPLPAMANYIPVRPPDRTPSIDELMAERWTAKQNKDYETADRLRAQIQQLTGKRVVDQKDKTILVDLLTSE